jgi:beta-lactamase regulating signal transducer with metallopeptidase domain
MIHAILNGDLSHALETLLAVSVLILVVLMLRRAVSRQFGAGIVYLLWAIPVVRFFMPPMTTPVSFLNLDLGGLAPAATTTTEHVTSRTSTAINSVSVEGTVSVVTPAGPASLPTAAPAMIDGSAFPVDLLTLALMTGVAVWVAGALYFAARSLITHYQFMKTVEREAMPVSARMADVAADLAAETGLRRPPRVVASLISRGPFVTGLLRPVVVMPAWFEEDYTPSEARAALAHEMMHVRRGDLWALQASELFVAALWFNPLAYIARNAFRTDQEAACDADVLSRCQTSPHAYGSTLVKAARLHLPEPVLAAARLPLTHALKERLTRMSYPAPSSRRRMIGFGAALLFGVSTLAITSSVAVAGEPDKSEPVERHEFRIEMDSLALNGGAEDRQMVLLGDPMAKVLPVPPMPPEVLELQHQIEIDANELSRHIVVGPVMDWTDSADWKEFEALAEEMANLSGGIVEHSADEDGKHVVVRVRSSGGEMTEEEREALMAKLEAKGAALEAKLAAREAEMDAHEAKMESKIIVLERRMEENGAEIERIMDERFGPEFEARIEAQADLVEELVSACEDAELATGETRIIERKDADGEAVRLACVEGDRANLRAASTLAAVDSYPGITEAEKAAFTAASEGQKRKHVMVFRSDDDGDMIEPPAAPETPETPATPKTPDTPKTPQK